jgi:predicted Zn finger-like uncharacterized protein
MSASSVCPACKARLKLNAQTAGKKVRCPKCAHVFVASAPEEEPVTVALADPEPGPGATLKCPDCGLLMGPTDRICTGCGYNRITGKKIRAGASGDEQEVRAGWFDWLDWEDPKVWAAAFVLLLGVGWGMAYYFLREVGEGMDAQRRRSQDKVGMLEEMYTEAQKAADQARNRRLDAQAEIDRAEGRPPDAPLETLHTAAAENDVGGVQDALAGGTDVNSRSRRGRTPLSLAAENGHDAAVELLPGKGADVHATDSDGRTAAAVAAASGKAKTLALLLGKGADADSAGKRGVPLLIVAVERGGPEVVRTLLAAGADKNARDKAGNTALMRAADLGKAAEAEAQVAAGADLEASLTAGTRRGSTALMLAASRGHREIVQLLLAKGAKADAKDRSGKTARDHALKAKKSETADLLK